MVIGVLASASLSLSSTTQARRQPKARIIRAIESILDTVVETQNQEFVMSALSARLAIMIGLVAFSVGALAAEDASPRCAANQVRAVHVESPNSAWQHWAVLPGAYVMDPQTGMLYGNQAALSSFGPNFFHAYPVNPYAYYILGGSSDDNQGQRVAQRGIDRTNVPIRLTHTPTRCRVQAWKLQEIRS